MIEYKGVELKDVSEIAEKREATMNAAMKGANEKLHAEMAFLKNALREKVSELQVEVVEVVVVVGGGRW